MVLFFGLKSAIFDSRSSKGHFSSLRDIAAKAMNEASTFLSSSALENK